MDSLLNKTRTSLFTLTVVILAVLHVTTSTASAQDRDSDTIRSSIRVTKGAKLKSLAKITEKQAGAAAMSQFPGSKVDEVDLENEDGFLVYNVELVLDGKEIDVIVDPGNGAILKAGDEDEDNDGDKDEEGVDEDDDNDQEMEDDDRENDEDDDDETAMVELPASVLSAFAKAFPKATMTGSDKEVNDGTTYYEIESVDGSTRRDLLYLANGTLYEMEELVKIDQLPAAVRAAASSHGRPTKAERLTRGSVVQYEVLVEKNGEKHELVLDPTGKILETKSAG